MKTKIKPLTKQEWGDLFAKVDSEGFGYYMLSYGPDLESIERLGFDRKAVEAACDLLGRVETKIMEGEEFAYGDES